MAKVRKFGYAELEKMIEDATDIKTVSAIIVIAMGYVPKKELSPYAFAGILKKASDKIYSISNN